MNAALLLAEAAAAGVHLEARIWVDRLDRLPPDLRGKLRDHQAEILAALVLQAGGGDGDAHICASVPVVADPAPPIEPRPAAVAIRHSMPVSWADDRKPEPGAYCSNCKANRWWTQGKGFCCSRCHPPIDLPDFHFDEVQT